MYIYIYMSYLRTYMGGLFIKRFTYRYMNRFIYLFMLPSSSHPQVILMSFCETDQIVNILLVDSSAHIYCLRHQISHSVAARVVICFRDVLVSCTPLPSPGHIKPPPVVRRRPPQGRWHQQQNVSMSSTVVRERVTHYQQVIPMSF